MQAKSESESDFSEFLTRTDALAAHLGIRVIDLPEKLGVSQDMLMGYRTGRYPVSRKAWRKLKAAEHDAGIVRYQERPEGMDRGLKEVGPEVRQVFTGPDVGWRHYLEMEALFDDMARERAGQKPTPEELAEFEELYRSFGRGRARGREALHRAVELASQIGERVLSETMAAAPDVLEVAATAGRRRAFRELGTKPQHEGEAAKLPHKKHG